MMKSARPFSVCLQTYRCIGSSCVISNFFRETRFITKMMQKGGKKTKWYDMNKDFRNTINVRYQDRSPSNHTVHRMIVRNKLFMGHITDQISMGEVSSIINGAIEITHVELTPDFKHINVFYYYTTDTPISEEVLQKCAWIIRHELSQLRVIGVVPPIHFVEDKQNRIQNEVEERLKSIESDFEESNILSYPEQMELAISQIDQALHKEPMVDNGSEPDESQIKLPVMRQDVLRLDHSKIMTRIVASMSKSRASVQRRMLDMDINADNSPHDTTSDKVAEFLTKNKQRELFKDFLKQRQIEEKRKYRMKRSCNQQLAAVVDYPKEEMDCEEDYSNKYNFDDEYCDDSEDERSSKDLS